jgi:hypothetical protein
MSPYFSTSANRFVKNKHDYSMCGQCQKEVLRDYSCANRFYTKWDKYHCKELTDKQYAALLNDLETLKETYNYVYDIRDINFCDMVLLSKKKVKTVKKKRVDRKAA